MSAPHKSVGAFCYAVAMFLLSMKTICSTTSNPTAPTETMWAPLHSSIQQLVVWPCSRLRGQS